MKTLGIDIGTTSIGFAVTDGACLLSACSVPNRGVLPAAQPWERLQDPAVILRTVEEELGRIFSETPDIAAIGLTGQMHGILYLDREGRPVSPLRTWQDGCGSQPFSDDETFAERLSRLTGYPASTGFGTVTHFYLQTTGQIPPGAAVFCTIHDYAAMVLAGNTRPLTDAADAASLGLFDIVRGRFDGEALSAAGMDPAFFPEVTGTRAIGLYRGKIPVYCATGDNQASFLGATAGAEDAMLVNIGTGSQFSARSPVPLACPGLEARPLPGGGYLLVGAALCGGYAYALLERFFRETAGAVSGNAPASAYEALAGLLGEGPEPEDLPVFTPLFLGTRQDPSAAASLTGLTAGNFTPRHLAWALVEGVAEELAALYRSWRSAGGNAGRLIGSGNGLRKNPFLLKAVEKRFGLPVILSPVREEAACGAAFLAAKGMAR